MARTEFQIIASTLPGFPDPSIAIAATKAGAIGALNLEIMPDMAQARKAISQLGRHAKNNGCIKLNSSHPEIVRVILASLPEAITTIILSGTGSEATATLVEQIRQAGRRILLETRSVEEAAIAETCQIDGLIAKGHEAGGWVGEETTFILIQRLITRFSLPVWAHGGIGLHTAAACAAAKAAGVVLDVQLALTRESTLTEKAKEMIASMDGSETISVAYRPGEYFRTYSRPRLSATETLQKKAAELARNSADPQSLRTWKSSVDQEVGWESEHKIWPIGQDGAFAADLSQRFQTVGGIVTAFRDAVDEHLRVAAKFQPLASGSPLALTHGTRYPIVQGPMTRVSDTAEFALRVAEGGGLPFLALALMQSEEADALLRKTSQALGSRPWGVGILGFVPLELRKEQLQVIRRYNPPFLIIAGGRADQAQVLEKEGIRTYLHVPSPALLKLFVQDGARRFVFEGRECGGHVGPRSSFVLWNSMIDTLLATVPENDTADCCVLFAGGVHDSISAAMVSTLAAPLAERGMRIGVLIGTAYLFTEEAVSSGTVLPEFQRKALQCSQTVLVETGPGHAIRCIPNDFTGQFQSIRNGMLLEGASAESIRNKLEDLNIGRLRVASKGLKRNPAYVPGNAQKKLVSVDEGEQSRDGMYMIGQVAALRSELTTIAQLHERISVEGSREVERVGSVVPDHEMREPANPSNIAIIGMSCILPKAPDLKAYWENILNKTYAVTEIPPDRWDVKLYFDPDRSAKDKIYSKWGGFIDDVAFDPLEFGMPPSSLPSIDPMQLLALKAAKAAIQDAGYLSRPFDRSRTSVILGASGGSGELGGAYNLRSSLPLVLGDSAAAVIRETQGILPEWTEDSFAGLLLNVVAGRIANRFDLGGLNFVVDAACASSLTAVHLAVQELESGRSDTVIAGGVDTVQTPFGYIAFSKTQALSPSGQPRTFDSSADGIAISEGLAFLVLKRLEDAERDGDRIYSVIQATAGSSDGKAKGLTAPRPEGQELALERAYVKAGFSPKTVGLFEAHGTGTVVGDHTEALSLGTFLERNGAAVASHAIGSVKSMLGHTKATAGVAGLAKAALSLYHKVLPPTLGVTVPNRKARFGEGPLYINSETRPWVHGHEYPRRAGVSAFGFGGTNFHAVLEEYTGEYLAQKSVSSNWHSELFLWTGASRLELDTELGLLMKALEAGAQPAACDLAFALARNYEERVQHSLVTLGIVASGLEDLLAKLKFARQQLADRRPLQDEARGVFCYEDRLAVDGSVAFVFPGQGSQYPNMLRDLAIAFPEAREALEFSDRILRDRFSRPLSEKILPPPAFRPEEEKEQKAALAATDVAQPALGAVGLAMLRVLQRAGVKASMFAGHSYGEFLALHAANVFDAETLIVLSEARGRSMIEAARGELGTMIAVSAGSDQILPLIESRNDLWIANFNGPKQIVVSGTRAGVEWLAQQLKTAEIPAKMLPVGCAFHSPIVAPAQEKLAALLSKVRFAETDAIVYSNSTAAAYPTSSEAKAECLSRHLAQPVRFAEQIEAMYQAGARVFVEVGPRNVLSGLIRGILGDRAHVAIATDNPARPGIMQLLLALGQLAAAGAEIRPSALFDGRNVKRLRLDRLVEDTKRPGVAATTWFVNGGRAMPANGTRVPVRRAAWNPAPPPDPTSPPSSNTANSEMQRTPSPASPAVAPTEALLPGADEVMLQFQNLMGKFLDTQRQVMSTYLGAAQVEYSNGVPAGTTYLPEPIGEPLPLAFTAPTLAEETLSAPPSNPPTPVGRDEIKKRLLEVVSERTGYPPDMLELDADVEAELGIDSIKRVEIIGALQQIFLASGEFDTEAMERLTGIKTLNGIVDWIAGAKASPLEAAVPAVQVPMTDVAHVTAEENISATLLGIVSERTGYPPEMLRLDADMEAELGIDSIKRIEVIGALQKALLSNEVQFDSESMEQLTSIKTMGGIVDWIRDAIRNGAPQRTSSVLVGEERVDKRAPLRTSLPRFQFVAIESPQPATNRINFRNHQVVVITEDATGVSPILAQEIRSRGGNPILVRCGSTVRRLEETLYEADFSNPDRLQDLQALIQREHGPLLGIIHLLPMGSSVDEATDLSSWKTTTQRDVKSLFHLLRAGLPQLQSIEAESNSPFVLAVAPMGGKWGSDGSRACSPAHRGLAGMLKTASLELKTVKCKAIDVDPAEGASRIAKFLAQELEANDTSVQVGYAQGKRWTIEIRSAAAEESGTDGLPIDGGSVLLITGGARGITAEIAIHIAGLYRPKLILVGRSPMPSAEEAAELGDLASAQAIRAHLVTATRKSGREVKLAAIEAECSRILRDREIRRNIDRMQRTGAQVQYEEADVCDEQAMASLVRRVQDQYGRLDGVIHGAGVIEDKKISQKNAESFDRVFDTKADSAFILGKLLPFDSLKFIVLFSSAAAAYGNPGQADYAAANAVLNQFAVEWDRMYACRVVAIGWGPWAGVGMVAPELQRQFIKDGIELIEPEAGCDALLRELRFGRQGESTVLAGHWSPRDQAAKDSRPANSFSRSPVGAAQS
jgi:acyl transferase domain-containing protein/NAD(P)H-dependent flavin oxidoreductase YrpB (nitropropane dioxygenase family)/acyl carrier protein